MSPPAGSFAAVLSAFADGRLFGERLGEGPAIVLGLHGWGRSRADLVPVLQGLPAVILDLPGFGASPAPGAAWGSADYAALVAVAAEELAGAEPAAGGRRGIVVLGHSFGGCVALQLAAARPDLVGALVLTGVPRLDPGARGPRPRPPLAYRLVRALASAGLVGRARLEEARRRYGSEDYRAAEGVMRDVLVRVLAEDLSPLLPGIACPVRLVWGADDTAAPVASARAAQRALAQATLDVLDGVGHSTPQRATAALRGAVLAALDGLRCTT